MNWYCIYTKPHKEREVEINLKRQGIEVLSPYLRERRIIRRCYRWIDSPLFPCYIFARFSMKRDFRLITYARGVKRIVGFGDEPAIVDDRIIEIITSRIEDNGGTIIVDPLDGVRSGDIVEIMEGPFKGLTGIFQGGLNGSERAYILLNMISNAKTIVSMQSISRVKHQ